MMALHAGISSAGAALLPITQSTPAEAGATRTTLIAAPSRNERNEIFANETFARKDACRTWHRAPGHQAFTIVAAAKNGFKSRRVRGASTLPLLARSYGDTRSLNTRPAPFSRRSRSCIAFFKSYPGRPNPALRRAMKSSCSR